MDNRFNAKHLNDLVNRDDLSDTFIDRTNNGFGYIQFGVNIENKHHHYIVIYDPNSNITYQEVGENLFADVCSYTNIFSIKREIAGQDCEGVIDAYGNVILPCIYKDITLDTEGSDTPNENTPILAVKHSGEHILFDRKGNQLGEPHKDIDDCDHNGVFTFRDENCSGLLDKKGNVILKKNYKRCEIVSEWGADINKYLKFSDESHSDVGITDMKGNFLTDLDTNAIHDIMYLGNDRFWIRSFDVDTDKKCYSQIIDFRKEVNDAN
ncbi:MAG: WG repeat-containing protein [Candidatus Gastranaerophilaceae bacterium]